MGKKFKTALVAVACSVALTTGIWLGVIWEASSPEPIEQASEVYGVEIWADGTAEVKTYIPYVQQIDEHTIVVTDKDMGAVVKDIETAIERGNVK